MYLKHSKAPQALRKGVSPPSPVPLLHSRFAFFISISSLTLDKELQSAQGYYVSNNK